MVHFLALKLPRIPLICSLLLGNPNLRGPYFITQASVLVLSLQIPCMYTLHFLDHSVGSRTCDPTASYSDFFCSADTRFGARCSADGYCRCPNIPHADECTCLGKVLPNIIIELY